MKKLLLIILTFSLFITGCTNDKKNASDDQLSDANLKIKGSLNGYMLIGKEGQLTIGDYVIKCTSEEANSIIIGSEIFEVEITYTKSDGENKLVDYNFIDENDNIITIKNPIELDKLVIEKLGLPKDGTYDGEFTIIQISDMYGFGFEDDESYVYIDFKVKDKNGKEIIFTAKSDETKNYDSISKLKVGKKYNFKYKTIRGKHYEVDYILLEFK